MFVSKEVIEVVFRIINFIILFYLFRHLFKKYLPTLKRGFLNKLAFFDNLTKQKHELEEQNKMMIKEIKDQDNLFELLKSKVKTWDKATQEAKSKKEEALAVAREQAKERNIQQTKNLQQQNLLQEALPKAIKETYQELEKKFEKKEKSDNFLKSIIGYMKKSPQ